MSKTLLLVDDHPLFINGFAAMVRHLRPDWALIAAACSAQAFRLLEDIPAIDLAIVDIQLPNRDGFETVLEIGARYPAVPRLMISGREDEAARARAFAAGACGYIAKSDEPERIIARIESLWAIGGDLPDGASPPALLSPRQFEVLMLLAEGCPNKEMRYRLGIAERTVRAHLTEVFHTLGVTSRVQALVRARAMNLIE